MRQLPYNGYVSGAGLASLHARAAGASAMSTNWRTRVAFTHDLVATAVAWLGAFWLRFNFDIPPDFLNYALRTLPWVVALHAPIFIGMSLYRSLWRFASIRDLRRIVLAAVLGAIITAAVANMLTLPPLRSVQVIAPVLLIMIMGATRLAYRAWKERRFHLPPGVELSPVLVLGGGEPAANLIKDLERSRQWRVVGLLTPEGGNVGRELHGVRLLGGIDKVARHAQALSVAHAIVAMPDAAHGERRKAVETAHAAGLSVQIGRAHV